MPPQTNADVLRRHGIVKPACCLCRLCEARRYVTQPAYWASVLCEPEIPDFAEWDMDHARGFQNEPELPFGDSSIYNIMSILRFCVTLVTYQIDRGAIFYLHGLTRFVF